MKTISVELVQQNPRMLAFLVWENYRKNVYSWLWLPMPVTPAPRRSRQETWEVKATHGYILSWRPV